MPKPNPESWAEQYYQGLTVSARDLRCQCYDDEKDYLGFKKIGTEPYPGKPTYSRCIACKKPPRYSLAGLVNQCEGCDKFYVPEEFPDKHGLCGACSAKIPTRPKRSRPPV